MTSDPLFLSNSPIILGTSLLVEEIVSKMKKSEVVQHPNHAMNFINFISLLIVDQNNKVLAANTLFSALSNIFHANVIHKDDAALVFCLKVISVFIESDPLKGV